MRIHDPKLQNMAQALFLSVFIAFKGTNFYIFICYYWSWSSRTSSILQIIFYFWSFEINGNILRNQKLVFD